MRLPNMTPEATPSIMSEVDDQTPPSFFLSWKAPAIVTAVTTISTGDVPSIICSSGSFRMPVVTEVGQSGPPTRMHTLGRPSPGCSRILRMERIVSEFTPMKERTAILLPMSSPISFCWIMSASSLSPNEMSDETITPSQNGRNWGSRKEPQRYTAKPGTGGIMNRTTPVTMKTPHTTPTVVFASSSVWMSHEMKTFVILPKPTFITMKKMPIIITLEKTDVHRHLRTYSRQPFAEVVSRCARLICMPVRSSAQSVAPRGSQK
mmetsp:Transcript_25884/g.66943  ORF Transcript_25884/g.66943 Transcript_25884/m.66943 type:complete len:263 (+) Transcript_25884:175-963(+)